MAEHAKKVAEISESVRRFYDRGEPFRIFHGSTNSTRASATGRDARKVVDTSSLNHVVSIDPSARTAWVEPNVPMDRLVEETLKHGLVPPVVMEFPGITVGGGYSGTSGESSSFKHGFFDRTLNAVEIVLADGEVVRASDSERQDLFRGAAGAVGSLGVTTMVEIQLRPAAKFVETTYHPVRSMEEAIEKLRTFTSKLEDFDYVDGIMYSPVSGAIITGRMTEKSNSALKVQHFSDASDPWFYLHVRDRIDHQTTSSPLTELIPLPDYLFRYDRGGFWVGAAAFEYFPGVPFNSWTRRFLDDFLHTRMLYKALHASGESQHMLVQDLALPYGTAAEFIERMDALVGIWPLWLCPLKQSPRPTMHPHHDAWDSKGDWEEMLNIGLWGKIRTNKDYISANREIERILQQLGGMKWLYAQTFSTKEEFWRDFDRPAYDALRTKYHAHTLPTVYEKVRVDVEAEARAKRNAGWWQRLRRTWPLAGLYGLRRAIASGDYLAARNPAWKHWVERR